MRHRPLIIPPRFPKIFFLALFVAGGWISAGLAADDLNNEKAPGGEWRSLLDENLSAWEIWMGVPHQSVAGLPPGTPTSRNGRSGTPMGLGNDPKHVFTVSMESGEPVLHVTGEIWGGLTTRESFTNYHLRVDVKWGGKKWEPRLNLPRNSGLLYHATGPHGAFWNTWKRSLEFEVAENDFGDLYPLGGTRADVAAKLPAKVWTYDPSGDVTTFGAGVKMPGWNHVAHLAGNFEKLAGEWNTLELYTLGNTAVHVVNGQVVNLVRNTAVLEGSPPATNSLDGGQLQLQSESAEVYYRRIQIQPITEIPAGILVPPLAAESSAPKRQTQVSIHGEDFYSNGQPTYAGQTWDGHRIEGLLLNARLVQGIFDDLNPDNAKDWAYPDTGKWDADRNTREFIAAMPSWRTNGLLAFTLNLQGGSPHGYGNSKEHPVINSAFNPDGSLRADYFSRLEKILDRADELGMVVILGYFYQGQDHVLTNETSVIRAVDNATDWVLDHDYHNVIVEINNECDQHYVNEILRPERVHELISRVQKNEHDGFHLLASTSYSGPLPKENVATNADFILVHGNGIKNPARITDSIRKIRALCEKPKPILFNEDDNYNFDQPTNNFTAAISEHASWGYFDYRRKGESFNEGFQCLPADWTIGSERKRSFFQLVSEMAGTNTADNKNSIGK